MASSATDASQQQQQDELDAILDAALDELDDGDNDENVGRSISHDVSYEDSVAAPVPPSAAAAAVPSREQDKDAVGQEDALLKGMLSSEVSDDEAAAMLESFVKQLQSDLANELEGEQGEINATNTSSSATAPDAKAQSVPEPAGPVRPPPPPPPPAASTAPIPAGPPRPPETSSSQVNSAIESLLENMAAASNEEVPPNMSSDETAMLEEMMREFEKLMPGGETDNNGNNDASTDALVNGMMQQLLSKELMYEPMKQVCGKFPSWLEEHKSEMDSEEYSRRFKQYECFQELVAIYDRDPENVERLMQLMESVQEYGQPPTEIVKEIAPGLELDEDGMPKIDPMMPSSEECIVM